MTDITQENGLPVTILPNNSKAFTPENIPNDLGDTPFFSGYRLTSSHGNKKPSKIPTNPVTGQNARINDAGTFVNFAMAIAGVTSGRCGGLNYAFGYNDFIGIDLDGVFDPVTGKHKSPEAAEIERRFFEAGAYVERSPSGTGTRIICRGRLERFGKGVGEFKHFEVYGSGPGGLHFLSITGNAVQTVETVPTCQGALDWLYEKYFKRVEAPQVAPSAELDDSPEITNDEVLDMVRRSKRSVEFDLLYLNGSTGDHSSDDLRLCSMLAFYTQDPEQIDAIFRESALYRDKWNRADYRCATIQKAIAGLKSKYQPRQSQQQYGFTEQEAAQRFHDSEEAENFQVLRQTKKPTVYRYSEGISVIDHHRTVLMRCVAAVSKTILAEMVNEVNADRRDRLFALAKKLESRHGLEDITSLVVLGLPDFIPDKADSRDYYLCLKNGVLYLSRRTLLHHCNYYQFTRQSPVIFDESAECPTFLIFIAEFCCQDAELIKFLQVWFGYCLSGLTVEHKAAVFWGYGQNGKSVLLELIKYIMGGFAATTPADTLLQRKSEQSNDIAALEGVRFVVASETDEGQALAEGRLKSITGGDEIVCRKLFEEFRPYKPRFKLNLATNSKPRVIGTDNGIWRRLLLIPCRAEIQNPDKQLFEKLKRESSGILNWLVEGFHIWQAEGLAIPTCVDQATREYRQESDIVGRFLEDNPISYDPVKSSKLYKLYGSWAEEQGHKAYSQVRFSQKLHEKGFTVLKQRDGNYLSRPK